MVGDIIQKLFRRNETQKGQWVPVKHSFVPDEALRDLIHERGYAVAGSLDHAQIAELKSLYKDFHDFDQPQGGMFYSVYSTDIDYRKKVHAGINRVLEPVYDSLFSGYKVMLSSFIVKVSGPDSEFSLHQDSTGLDETQYSCLSAWIPLQDTDLSNGCMCVVPYSHRMFSPYRGISFPQPFDNISDTVRKYLQPIELKAGQILLFDNRLVHNSVVNSSGRDRVVVMSGIFPEQASLLSCYKDSHSGDSKIELIAQEEDYLLTYKNFNHDCTCRPDTGRSAGFVEWDLSAMKEERFIAECKKYGLEEINLPLAVNHSTTQAIIGEPVSG